MTTLPPARPATTFSPARVGAMVVRYWYLLRSSWPRLLELVYWPAVQLLMWGFLQQYFTQRVGVAATVAATLIGAVLLWDVLMRAQIGFSVSFLEEMWSRNLANLMMSPLRPSEFLAALMAMSIIRLLIGMVPVSLMALVFFNFNIYAMGLTLAAFFAILLMTAWSVGLLVCGLVLRHGLGAEIFTWSLMFLLLPFTCVYYPVATLPEWLQWVAWSLPPTYVFEGMRALLIEQTFRGDLLVQAFLLNIVYLAAGATAFLALLESARRHGSLLQVGE